MEILGNNSWVRGHVKPWWGLKHRGLPFINEPFNNSADLKIWRDLGFTQTKFTGDMYDMRFASTDWLEAFGSVFPCANLCWSVYKMTPGTVLPTHSDSYKRYKSIYGLEESASVVRIIVYLEDWQSGHYSEMNGEPVIKWQAGDWVCWSDGFPHLAANLGPTDRYTVQLTGTL